MNTEQNYTLEQTGSISKFLKFFIPSLLGLFLFIIPLPFGKIFNVSGVSPVNIGVGFISELLKLAIGDYIPTICLVIIVLSARRDIKMTEEERSIQKNKIIITVAETAENSV